MMAIPEVHSTLLKDQRWRIHFYIMENRPQISYIPPFSELSSNPWKIIDHWMKVSTLIEKADALWDEQNMEVVKSAEVELLQRPELP
jgi:hypothetical protein